MAARWIASATLTLLALPACGGSGEAQRDDKSGAKGEAGSEQGGADEAASDAGSAIERVDVNGDGKADVYKFYRVVSGEGANAKKSLIRKEMDVNFDQKVDIVQYFEGEPGKEILVREEMDLDFDGRVDEIRHYKDGVKHLVELDLGFDGRTDTWRYYQQTKTDDGKTVVRLVEKRRDTNGDGAVDVWEYYVGGKLVKVGHDTNNDGAPDRFTKTDEKKK